MFIRLSFVMLIFALAALGTPLVKRDAAGVLRSIQQLDEQTNVLYEDLDKLPTMGRAAVKDIETTVANMDASLKTATDTTNDSKDFTTDQTNDILKFVEEQLESDVKTALVKLVSEKPTITALGVAPLAEFSMQTLQVDTADLANALTLKVPENMRSGFKAALGNIENELSDAIRAYHSN